MREPKEPTMTTAAPAPTSVPAKRRPWPWLVVIGLIGLVGASWIWSMRELGQICTLQYPPPPGCGASAPQVLPTVVMALVVAGFVVAAIAWFLASPRRLTLILVIVAASLVAVTLIAAAVIGFSMTVVYAPPILID
jgi:hypothetical protein